MSGTVQIAENPWTGQRIHFVMCHGSDPNITSLKPFIYRYRYMYKQTCIYM
jgi:hypothetical protein